MRKIDRDRIDFLAKLPSLDELRGKFRFNFCSCSKSSITIEPGAKLQDF